MRITDEDLKGVPPGEDLIKIVKDAIGMGDSACRREAQDALAEAFYGHFREVIDRRYHAYLHIGATYEMDDDLERVCMYVLFGYREDSKNRLIQNKHPLRTWMESLEDSAKARSLYHYVMSIANNYLKRDLPRNIVRGRGNESLVTWTGAAVEEGTATESQDRIERKLELRAHETVKREKMDEEDMLALRRCVRECLDQLPSEEHDLLLARYCPAPDEDFRQSEYAKETGVSAATVSRRIAKGKATLANLLRSACPDLLQRCGWSKRAPSNTP